MATSTVSQNLLRGGAFLIASTQPEDVFTPADLSDDQRLIGQTAEEFVAKEVCPLIPELEQHKEGLMARIAAESGRIGPAGRRRFRRSTAARGLDKVSRTVLAEKLAVYASFAVSHGGHAGIGTIPIVYFGTEAQKKKYLPKIASGELLACYCLSEPQAGSDALAARTRAVLSPTARAGMLNGQKMWITNGGFAESTSCSRKWMARSFPVSSWSGARRDLPSAPKKTRWGSAAVRRCRYFSKCGDAEGKFAARNRARAHRGVQHAECGAIFAGRILPGRSEENAGSFLEVLEGANGIRQNICEFGLIKAKLGEMAIRTLRGRIDDLPHRPE